MKHLQQPPLQTYRQLMGNGVTYEVPPFQRDYSWSEAEWDDLWADIHGTLEEAGEGHYLGYLIFEPVGDKHYRIIDGQQRLTTLSLLVLAVANNLKTLIEQGQAPADNQSRLAVIKSTYIGYTDPASLQTKNKLTLNRNNNGYYKNYLVPLEHLPIRQRKQSELQMRRCFQWFDRKVGQQYRSGEALGAFVDRFVDLLYFSQMHVESAIQAYKIFETLNARGTQLTVGDLLKNHLFSIAERTASAAMMDQLEERWSDLMTQLQQDPIEKYLRCYWNSRYPLQRRSQLFKAIGKQVKNGADVLAWLKALYESAEYYRAFKEPSGIFWTEQQAYHKAKAPLTTLALFGAEAAYAPLLAGYRVLSAKQFVKLTQTLMVVALRYLVIGRYNTSEWERRCNQLALAIHQERQLPYRILQRLYGSQQDFNHRFTHWEARPSDKKIPRYLLATLEHHQSGQEIRHLDSTYTLEHILPQKADEETWSDIGANDYDRMTHRLGNLTLLEKTKNEGLGNADYEQKKAVFATSSCQLTRRIPEYYDTWSVDAVLERQARLAQLAAQVWRIQELEA